MSATSNLTGKVLFSKALVRRLCKNEVFDSDQCFNIFDGILLWVMMIMMNFFFRNGWPKKNDINPYFQPGAMSEVPTIRNIRHTTSRIWACEDQSTGFVEWSCAVVISATPKRHEWWLFLFKIKDYDFFIISGKVASLKEKLESLLVFFFIKEY